MLKLLIIFAACIQVYLFEVIDINNCINGANITTKCGYKIYFTNIGNKSLHCILNFTSSNQTVKFNNYGLYAKAEEANKCPNVDLNIITVVNGTTKDNKLSTTCGGTIEKMERIFSNFSSFLIKVSTKGLNDQDSKVNMSLVIVDCKESWIRNNSKWIIIAISATGVSAICLSVSGCYCSQKCEDVHENDKIQKKINSFICDNCQRKISGNNAKNVKEKTKLCNKCEKKIDKFSPTCKRENTEFENREIVIVIKQKSNNPGKENQQDCVF